MEIIPRNEIKAETYREILDVETHHNHPIIKDEHGTLRWQKNPDVDNIVNKLDFNALIMFFHMMDMGKNSELYRKMYRDIGYSLSGYWEIFYWEANNEDADKYVPDPLFFTLGVRKYLVADVRNAFHGGREQINHSDWDYIYEDFKDYAQKILNYK